MFKPIVFALFLMLVSLESFHLYSLSFEKFGVSYFASMLVFCYISSMAFFMFFDIVEINSVASHKVAFFHEEKIRELNEEIERNKQELEDMRIFVDNIIGEETEYSEIQIDMSDDDFFKIAQMAYENDLTINEQFVRMIEESVGYNKQENKNG